jgi:hypothetical protein
LIQDYLGHKNITHTVRYLRVADSPDCFEHESRGARRRIRFDRLKQFGALAFPSNATGVSEAPCICPAKHSGFDSLLSAFPIRQAYPYRADSAKLKQFDCLTRLFDPSAIRRIMAQLDCPKQFHEGRALQAVIKEAA